MMGFFTLKELVDWLGLTVFEIFLHTFGVLVFSLLLVLHHEQVLHASAWQMFSPLFICDGLAAYFCIIVFVRQCREKEFRNAITRLLSSLSLLVCFFVCKFLLCEKLEGKAMWSYGAVFAPVFVALQVLMARACQPANGVNSFIPTQPTSPFAHYLANILLLSPIQYYSFGMLILYVRKSINSKITGII